MYTFRQSFIQDIEEQRPISNVVEFGRNLVSFYLDNMIVNENMTENPIVNNAINYIHNNLSKDLTLDKVADANYISKSYLSSLFTEHTGNSFSHYLRLCRIDKSKELMVNTNMSLLDIALECGFNSQSYFCNVFRDIEGLTPRQYRCLQLLEKIKKPL